MVPTACGFLRPRSCRQRVDAHARGLRHGVRDAPASVSRQRCWRCRSRRLPERLALTVHAALWVVAAVMVAERVVAFALANPAIKILYTLAKPDEKYKVQNFVDTVVYRGGDARRAGCSLSGSGRRVRVGGCSRSCRSARSALALECQSARRSLRRRNRKTPDCGCRSAAVAAATGSAATGRHRERPPPPGPGRPSLWRNVIRPLVRS